MGVEVHPTILSMSYSTQPSGVKTHPPDMSNFDKSNQTFLQANIIEMFKDKLRLLGVGKIFFRLTNSYFN